MSGDFNQRVIETKAKLCDLLVTRDTLQGQLQQVLQAIGPVADSLNKLFLEQQKQQNKDAEPVETIVLANGEKEN